MAHHRQPVADAGEHRRPRREAEDGNLCCGGANDALPPTLFGLLTGLLVLAAAIYGALSYDPQAFTLRSSESFEHRGEAAPATAVAQEHDDED